MRIAFPMMPPGLAFRRDPLPAAPPQDFTDALGQGVAPAALPDLAQTLVAPSEAAAAETILMQPAGQQRDEERALRAFAFSVFGVFPPGLADAPGSEAPGEPTTLEGAPEASAGPAAAPGPNPTIAVIDRLSALPAAAAATGPSAASADGGALALLLAPVAAPPGIAPAGETEPSLPPSDTPESLPRPGAAPALGRAPAPGRPAASLILSEQDGRLSVLAAAARLAPSDQAAARERLRDAAASLGVTLDEIQLNGLTGATPATGGGSHGRRTR
jgi:hypothetical protein